MRALARALADLRLAFRALADADALTVGVALGEELRPTPNEIPALDATLAVFQHTAAEQDDALRALELAAKRVEAVIGEASDEQQQQLALLVASVRGIVAERRASAAWAEKLAVRRAP